MVIVIPGAGWELRPADGERGAANTARPFPPAAGVGP
jgi:hypothetical protein